MSATEPTFHSVVAIDDHPIVLESIQALLAGSPHLQLVATAADGAQGLQLIRSARLSSPSLISICQIWTGWNSCVACARSAAILA